MPRFNMSFRVVLLALLCLGTITFSATCNRYVTFGGNLLRNPLFQKKLIDWQVQQGDSVSLHEEILTLSNGAGNNNRSVSVFQTIILPSGQRLLVLSCEARVLGVIPGKKGWETARVVIAPLTAEGKPRYDVPHTLVALGGTTPWTRFEQVFRVPGESMSVSVTVQILNASGTLEVRHITLRSAIEDPSYSKWRFMLALVWFIAGLWIVWPLLRATHDRIGRNGVLVTGSIILAGVLMPASMKYALTPSWLLPETEAPGPFRADLLLAMAPFRFELLPTELNIYKLAHFFLFAIIGYLLTIRRPFEVPTWMLIGIVALFALATESAQVLASGRGGSLGDVIIDMSGVCCGMLVAIVMRHQQHAQKPRAS